MVNMVELLEIAARLKCQRLTLLGEPVVDDRLTRPKYAPESLATWIAQELRS